MNLSGNTILITGGSAGIGLSLAKEFLRLGNKVIITGRNLGKLEAVRKETPELHVYQSDVSDANAIVTLAQQVKRDHPKLNVLINNAGIFEAINLTAPAKDMLKLTQEIDINLSGTIRTTSAFIDTLIKNKGVIMNVSSGLAYVPLMIAPIYCATKAGIHSYSVSLRFQLEEKGVEVIELMPPAVRTELTADMPEDGDFKLISTEELIKQTMKDLKAGKNEICPGQASQLRMMSRLVPGFINKQLAKGSKSMMPQPN